MLVEVQGVCCSQAPPVMESDKMWGSVGLQRGAGVVGGVGMFGMGSVLF